MHCGLSFALSLVALAFVVPTIATEATSHDPSITTTPYPTSTADDMISGWGTCPECDFCIVRNDTAKCFFVIHSVTWLEARSYCENMSAELAVIRSDVETRFLNRTKSILGIGYTNAWIGLRWKASANYWLWVDDVPIKTIREYNAFAPGMPGEGWFSCIEFIARDVYNNYLGNYPGYWANADCNAKRDAICQYSRKLVPE